MNEVERMEENREAIKRFEKFFSIFVMNDSVTIKNIEHAREFKVHLEEINIACKIKSHFGKHYHVVAK